MEKRQDTHENRPKASEICTKTTRSGAKLRSPGPLELVAPQFRGRRPSLRLPDAPLGRLHLREAGALHGADRVDRVAHLSRHRKRRREPSISINMINHPLNNRLSSGF